MNPKRKNFLAILIIFIIIGGLFFIGKSGFSVLSGARAFVGGEGLWAKGQKEATYQLIQYIFTSETSRYQSFVNSLKVPIGDKAARLELEKPDPVDEIIIRGFRDGDNHASDIPTMIFLYRYFKNTRYVKKAIEQWETGDQLIGKLLEIGEQTNLKIANRGMNNEEISKTLASIDVLQKRLDQAEELFSQNMSAAARQMAKILSLTMLLFTLVGGILCFVMLRLIAKIISDLDRKKTHLENQAEQERFLKNELKESEAFIKKLINAIPTPIFYKDRDGKYLWSNNAFETFIGKTKEQLMGKSVFEINSPELAEIYHVQDNNLLDKGGIQRYDSQMENARGEMRDIIFNKAALTDNMGTVTGLIGTITDITERKKTEEALRESESFFSQMFEQSTTSTCLYNPDGTINRVNDEFCKMFGVEQKVIIDAGYNVFNDKASADAGLIPLLKEVFHEKKTNNWETMFDIDVASASTGTPTSKAGKIFIEVFGYPVLNRKGNLEYVVLQHYDITVRKQAEEALRESEERYRIMMEQAADAVFVHEKSGRILDVNQKACQNLGYSREEMLSMSLMDINPEMIRAQEDKIWGSIPAGEHLTIEASHTRKDGSSFPVELALGPVNLKTGPAILSIARDITERKHLESQLQQSQKMEAVGTLAGGIAHDFNNILAIILGNAELATDDVPDSNPAHQSLKKIHQASIRAKDMVQQLLAFSRKTEGVSTPINLAPIIKESMKMLRSAIPTSIEFKQHISSELCTVMGDAAQINQIVMNLVTNAADAMSKEGGLLEMTLEHIILREEKPCFDWVLSPGAYVRLGMRDTGEGIAANVAGRIFEPYFTSKEVGKGTGMGLSVIHGIVKRHGGGIRVESELGKGTLFEIYFPAMEKTAVEKKVPEGEIIGGSETILFVDDEEFLVDLNQQRLERLGYNVVSTTKPVEALEWFKADPDRFDAVITDMTMPRMTGDRLTAEVLKIRPHMPVIICTGYSERMSVKRAEALGVRKYIEKPVDLRNLASTIRDVIED